MKLEDINRDTIRGAFLAAADFIQSYPEQMDFSEVGFGPSVEKTCPLGHVMTILGFDRMESPYYDLGDLCNILWPDNPLAYLNKFHTKMDEVLDNKDWRDDSNLAAQGLRKLASTI